MSTSTVPLQYPVPLRCAPQRLEARERRADPQVDLLPRVDGVRLVLAATAYDATRILTRRHAFLTRRDPAPGVHRRLLLGRSTGRRIATCAALILAE